MAYETLQIDKICRTCLCEDQNMRSVFSMDESAGETARLFEMLTSCASVQVAQGDGLPAQVCLHCVHYITRAFSFKQLCERSDHTLRDFVSKSQFNYIEELKPCISQTLDSEPIAQLLLENDLYDVKEIEASSITYNDNLKDFNAEDEKNICDIGPSEVLDVKTGDDAGEKLEDFVEKETTGSELTKCKKPDETDIPLYPCEHCTACFTVVNDLKVHQRAHKRVVKHTCKVCNQEFASASTLCRHSKLCVDDTVGDPESSPSTELREVAGGTLQAMLPEKTRDPYDKEYETFQAWCNDENEVVISEDMLLDYFEMKSQEKRPSTLYVKYSMLRSCLINYKNVDISQFSRVKAFINEIRHGYQPKQSKILEEEEINHFIERADDYKYLAVKVHESAKRHLCSECGKGFTRSDDLTRHLRIHTGEKPFGCKLCGKCFAQSFRLLEHMRAHANEKSFVCAVCGKAFSRYTSLAAHNKTHLGIKTHECKMCGKKLCGSGSLAMHMKTHTGLKDHICPYCGKGFSTPSNLIIHKRTHTGERPYICNVCGKGFPDPSRLTVHTRTHSGEKPYVCTSCGRGCVSSSQLKKHMRIHTGEKPYRCNLCPKAYPRSEDLRVHIKTHTGDRNHVCNICKKGFYQASTLKVHMRIHTGEKPYTCKICNKAFSQTGPLSTHMKTH